jgi:hypothetical protein
MSVFRNHRNWQRRAGFACRATALAVIVAGCDSMNGFEPTTAPKPTVAPSAAALDTGNGEHCELVNGPEDGTCGQSGGDGGAAIAVVAGLAAIGLANNGNFDHAAAVLQAAAPLVDSAGQSGGGSGDGSCTPGPRCASARADWQQQLSVWESEAQGAGVGRLYGYAWCGSDLTRQVAELCAAEQRDMGNPSCAETLEANARDAAGKAEEALIFGRDVGVDARQTGPCG